MARRFVDARGTEWEVWKVEARPTLADSAPRGGRGAQAWLMFESATQRRRLARFPAWWEALGAAELETLCGEARPEPMGFADRGRGVNPSPPPRYT